VLLHRVVVKVNFLQLSASLEVVEVVDVLNIIAFAVQNLQVLQESNVE
jgi:hypothetical protein